MRGGSQAGLCLEAAQSRGRTGCPSHKCHKQVWPCSATLGTKHSVLSSPFSSLAPAQGRKGLQIKCCSCHQETSFINLVQLMQNSKSFLFLFHTMGNKTNFLMIEASFMLLWGFFTFWGKDEGEGGHEHLLVDAASGFLSPGELVSLVVTAFVGDAGHSKSPVSEVNLSSPSLLCSLDH